MPLKSTRKRCKTWEKINSISQICLRKWTSIRSATMFQSRIQNSTMGKEWFKSLRILDMGPRQSNTWKSSSFRGTRRRIKVRNRTTQRTRISSCWLIWTTSIPGTRTSERTRTQTTSSRRVTKAKAKHYRRSNRRTRMFLIRNLSPKVPLSQLIARWVCLSRVTLDMASS